MLITTSGSVGVIEQNSNRWIHTFGDFNTFLGLVAGNFTMTGTANTGTGYRVFQNNTSGSNNTANGYRSLANNTTGDQNTASGSYSLNFNTTGVGNTATGVSALGGNATGNYNTADGVSALISNDNGHDNTASGYSAMYTNNHGNFNTASGSGALYHSTVDGNTAFGYQALTADYTGDGNTAVGYQALNSDSSGCCNIAIGTFAGSNIISSWNIDIGNPGVAADTNTLRIGTSGGGGQNRAFVAGIRGVTTGAADAVPVVIDSNGQLGTTSSSRRFKFDIAEMSSASDKLMNLRPVTFRYLAHGENAPLQYGLIAEEVAEVYPEMVARNKDGEVETIMYQFLAPMLLNEVQKQHRQIEEQQKIIDALLAQRAAENTAMRNQIDRLLQRVDQLDGKRNASEEIRNALK